MKTKKTNTKTISKTIKLIPFTPQNRGLTHKFARKRLLKKFTSYASAKALTQGQDIQEKCRGIGWCNVLNNYSTPRQRKLLSRFFMELRMKEKEDVLLGEIIGEGFVTRYYLQITPDLNNLRRDPWLFKLYHVDNQGNLVRAGSIRISSDSITVNGETLDQDAAFILGRLLLFLESGVLGHK